MDLETAEDLIIREEKAKAVAAERAKWIGWLRYSNYGIDWRNHEVDPPCSLRELATLWAADDESADTEDYMATIEYETGDWKGDRT